MLGESKSQRPDDEVRKKLEEEEEASQNRCRPSTFHPEKDSGVLAKSPSAVEA